MTGTTGLASAGKLLPGAKKLTTRFFSVQITGVGTGLFEMEPPKVRVNCGRRVSRSRRRECLVWLREATGERNAELTDTDSRQMNEHGHVMVTMEEGLAAENGEPRPASMPRPGLNWATIEKIETAFRCKVVNTCRNSIRKQPRSSQASGPQGLVRKVKVGPTSRSSC